jgi:hypothetical protein
MKRNLAWFGIGLFVCLGALPAQGVGLKKDAVVYCGSASNSTAPAAIDDDKVREATPEWKTIQSEGVKKGTARYKLLIAEMDKRIRAAVKAAAGRTSHDLVVNKGDVEDARGKEVADLTADVIARLETMAAPLTMLEESLTGETGALPSST